MLINLKPLSQRHGRATDVIRDLQARARQRRRHHAVHAAGAGPDDRGPGQPDAIPVHDRGHEPGRIERLGSAHRRASAADSAAGRRRQRPAGRRPAGLRGHRPRDGEPLRDYSGRDRQRVVQRVRPATGVDDIHADESVSRRAGSKARVPARAGSAVADLCAGRQRLVGAGVGRGQRLGGAGRAGRGRQSGRRRASNPRNRCR